MMILSRLKIAAILLFATNVQAVTLDCKAVLEWGNTAWELDKNTSGGFHQGTNLLQGLNDNHFKPVFGKSFMTMSEAEISALEPELIACLQEARVIDREAWKEKNKALRKKIQTGSNYLRMMLRVKSPDIDPANYSKTMAHQQQIYNDSQQASGLLDEQISQAENMTPSMGNINKIKAFADNSQLRLLPKQTQQMHKQKLDELAVALTNKYIDSEIKKFDQFQGTFKDLEAFTTHTQNMLNQMSQLKSNRWRHFTNQVRSKKEELARKAYGKELESLQQLPLSFDSLRDITELHQRVTDGLSKAGLPMAPDFNQTYMTQLNKLAAAGLDGFKERLKSLPNEDGSLKLIYSSVNELFGKTPTPSNLKQYQDAANKQYQILSQQLAKAGCYKTLSAQGIETDSHDLGLLGDQGPTTFGLFMCHLSDRGFQVLSYEPPGAFSRVHSLEIKMPRGVGLTLELQPMEVSAGETLLVGTSAKDASEEKTFTLSQWQNYAQQLVHTK